MPFVEAPSGVTIQYESKGEGNPLVFIHGWSMSGRVWRYQADALASSYRVITMDLRGHGDSSGQAAGYAFEDFAADTAELFEQLGLRNAVLIGWSMGVQVAIRAFKPIKDRLAALVFVGGTPKFTASDDYPCGLPPAETRSMAIRLRRNYVKTMGDFFHGMFAEGELSRDSYQHIVRDMVMGGKLPERETALKTLDTLVSSDLRPLLREIDVPVLLVHGSKDIITMPEASRYMTRYLPHATLKIIEGTGHAPFISRPEGFNALLHSFMEVVYGDN